ncbi:hypothetical protein PAPHI01_0941 [Pancytospora philotis]|nr:hypothetical protein PAPHI01_0941 [Pancytospora philotis]
MAMSHKTSWIVSAVSLFLLFGANGVECSRPGVELDTVGSFDSAPEAPAGGHTTCSSSRGTAEKCHHRHHSKSGGSHMHTDNKWIGKEQYDDNANTENCPPGDHYHRL